MEDKIIQFLRRLGLTDYESKVYLAILLNNCDSASSISKISKVPRTKIYQILDSLAEKKYIEILSGYPLIFTATAISNHFENLKKEFEIQINALQKITGGNMREKHIVDNIGSKFSDLEETLKSSKEQIWISNATESILKNLAETLASLNGIEIKITLFPGEICPSALLKKVLLKESKVKIVHLVKGKEYAAINIIVDKKRVFNILDEENQIIQEMLYDTAKKDFLRYFNLGWKFAKNFKVKK